MVIVTAIIDEARRHELGTDAIKAGEQAINEALERGRARVGWFLDGQGEEIVVVPIAWNGLSACATAGHTPDRPSMHHSAVR
ncbi:hypothetical protein [Paraburkholderia humisilvae]|nr:hypothetical protein [Paraburkholderia humisilvae]